MHKSRNPERTAVPYRTQQPPATGYLIDTIMPYSEPPITEQTRFKKLGKEMKAEFKWLAASVTVEYWEDKRQIPFGEEMSKLRIRLLRMFAEEYGILLKEDTELKNYLLTLVITTINKQLKPKK